MGKILSLVLGLAVISFVAYKAISGRSLSGDNGGSTVAPTQNLQNVRGAAKRIEEQSTKNANEALEKSQE
jgi:hypothetical protein